MNKSITLHLRKSTYVSTYYQQDIRTLCGASLQEYFNLPKDTQTITVTLSTKETEDSYAVRFGVAIPVIQIHYNNDWFYEATFANIKKILTDFLTAAKVDIAYFSISYEV